MARWLKIVIILIILGAVSAAGVYFFIINKPHPDFEKMSPQYSLVGQELFNSYKTHKAVAESKFNGKLLEISGPVSAIETTDSLVIVVMAFGEGDFGTEGIRCTVLKKYQDDAKRLVSGGNIRIKGFCTGYNDTDVILEQCSLISQVK
jgi:hypothetical protein